MDVQLIDISIIFFLISHIFLQLVIKKAFCSFCVPSFSSSEMNYFPSYMQQYYEQFVQTTYICSSIIMSRFGTMLYFLITLEKNKYLHLVFFFLNKITQKKNIDFK